MRDTQDNQKRKIPGALTVISYLYFLNGVWLFVYGGFLMFLVVSTSGFHVTDANFIWVASMIAIGLFLMGISRGLRHCSRGWRTCALILTWLGMLAIIFDGYKLLAPYLQSASHQPVPELSTNSILLLVGALLFQLWQLRVLTRLDVRDLFYDER